MIAAISRFAMSLRKEPIIPGEVVLAGIVIAVVFWIVEAAVHSLLFDPGAGFADQLLPSDPNEFWMRLLVFALIIAFSVYAQRVVTRLREAERRARESERMYREMIETAEEGVWVLDAHGRTSFANHKMAAMLGYQEEEVDEGALAGFADERSRKAAEGMLDSLRHGLKGQHEILFRRKDGSELWAMVSATPLLGQDGSYSGALAMVNDMTARKQAEEALRCRVEELERFRRATIEREFRIKELRDKVARLEGASALKANGGG